MVFGLDHLLSEQEADQEEISAVRKWLEREGTCLLLGPHHDVGFTEDLKQRQQEYLHHGDTLVPRQQRFGQYTRSMMKGLGVPVMNQFGLRPALVKGTRQIAPLTINRDLDELGLLNGVTTFNFHPHLPHYAMTGADAKSVHVLTRQPIDLERSHPFVEAGNTEFNSCIWMPPIPSAQGTSYWRTPRSSLRCLVASSRWRRFGRILRCCRWPAQYAPNNLRLSPNPKAERDGGGQKGDLEQGSPNHDVNLRAVKHAGSWFESHRERDPCSAAQL